MVQDAPLLGGRALKVIIVTAIYGFGLICGLDAAAAGWERRSPTSLFYMGAALFGVCLALLMNGPLE